MKRLLLLMPQFMGYEKALIERLQTMFDVTWVDCDQYDKQILEQYNRCSKIHWRLRHYMPKLKEKEFNKIATQFTPCFLKSIQTQRNYYSVVFCINGAYLPDDIYQILKESNPDARFIYYAWDDVKNLVKSSQIAFFDEIYSYNIRECKQNGWTYLPMFVQGTMMEHAPHDEYDMMYLGSAHSDRQRLAEKLYDMYADRYRLFIYLYDPTNSNKRFCHNQPLTYDEYLQVMQRTKAILDVPHITQEGPTTRVFDALLTKTKVITTNTNTKEYPIYSDNILIVDRNTLVIDENFLEKPYTDNVLEPLTISTWLETFNMNGGGI